MFLQMAFNNVLRNYRRSLSTILAIAVGVSMIVFAMGFNDGVYRSFASSIINSVDSHVRIRHQDFAKYSTSDIEKILIENPGKLISALESSGYVEVAVPRVNFGGLLGDDTRSTTFFGQAYDAEKVERVLPGYADQIVEGSGLNRDEPEGAILGKKLAESLGVGVGDELVIISNSIYSDQTAIRIKIRGLIKIDGMEELERSFVIADINQVQKTLLDVADSAMELVVRLNSEDDIPAFISWAEKYFASEHIPLVAVPWYDNGTFQQVLSMFRGVAMTVATILAMLVGIIISSALLMSILERIPEIGTLRAIGANKSDIYRIYFYESMIVASAGAILGIVLGLILILLGSALGIEVPGSGFDIIHPTLRVSGLLLSLAFPFGILLLAIWYPLRSSCKLPLVDALNHR